MVGAIEPMLRAKLMMALLALVVLGLGLMAMIVMGGRFARRVARTPLPPSRIHDDRWYAKPLNASETDQADADEPASDGTSGSDERPDADGPADSDGSRG